MELEDPKNPPTNPFDGLNSEDVLDKVPAGLASERSRSLWRRIESELNGGGVGAVDTYLRSLFSEVNQRAHEELALFRNDLS
jgi:hypothetical protein